jgi:hypothetical protein
MLDVALIGIQKMRGREHVLSTRVSGHSAIYWLQDAKEVPDTQALSLDFGDLMMTWELRSFGAQAPSAVRKGARVSMGVKALSSSIIRAGKYMTRRTR